MRNLIIPILIFLVSCQPGQSQTEVKLCQDEAFNKRVHTLLNYSVPVIGVQELNENKEEYLILDAREKKEFNLSHIPDAKNIGYEKLDLNVLKNVSKDQKVVLYCSVGYRSEKIGEKLQRMGFRNVHNLYGSIFEWANQELPLVNDKDRETKKVHTYNKQWSRWLINKGYEKVY